MKKPINKLWLVLYLIFPVVFNILFFVLSGGDRLRNASTWISYVSIHFAYIMLVITPMLVREGKSAAIFGFALKSISAAYFVTALIAGVLFILNDPETVTAALSVQLVLAGLYGITLISNVFANEKTAVAEEERQHQISYVKSASAQLKGILDRISDKETARKVERAYDAVASSPVKTHPNLAQTETKLLSLIDELSDAVTDGGKQDIISKADSLLSAVNERNNRLKNLNE